MRNPRILLLDEATSALDAESEKIIQEAIDKLIADKSFTVVVVAHRLSTVQDAEEILVLDKGEIVERGTHHKLLEKAEGKYRKLVSKQLFQENETKRETEESKHLKKLRSQHSQNFTQRRLSMCSDKTDDSNAPAPSKQLSNQSDTK